MALGQRLSACRNVLTLGVKPNFTDYAPEAQALIRGAKKIYYPTTFYADLLDAAGIATFPSYHTYKCVQDKIKQTALFTLLGLPHPRTRVFYGKREHRRITALFPFPFIAKIPRGSAMGRGVFLIRNPCELEAYLDKVHAAYIQEYLPVDRDIRVVVIGGKAVLSYWRIAASGEFRHNVARGGRVAFHDIPRQAVALAEDVARRCRWDDVGLDIFCQGDRYAVIEANMKYGREGFRKAGIDYVRLMEKLIDDDRL